MADIAEITQILLKAKDGSKEAYDQLFPMVYDQLRDIAYPVSYTHLTLPTIYSV